MPTKKSYYFRFGSRRIPWMRVKEGNDGSQYVIFPMDRKGFKISIHPLADPHMKDASGYLKRLDLRTLRSVDWEKESKSFQTIWDSLFYWPSHRADLIAIPGPPGKTWVEGFESLFQGDELDIFAYVKAIFGYGVIYKIGHQYRKAFFETDIGRGCLIIDPRERRFGFYAGKYPERPLFGVRWEDGGIPLPMPRPLNEWKETLDSRLELVIEQYLDEHIEEIEAELSEVFPGFQKFVDGFRIVRWRPNQI